MEKTHFEPACHAADVRRRASAGLGGGQLTMFLLELGGLVLLAMLAGRLAARLGMPSVAGELLVGVVLGPSLLGRLPAALSTWLPQHNPSQLVLLQAVGQLGVVLLVGLTGAQLDLKLVRERGGAAMRVGLAGLIVPLGLGIAIGFVLPLSMMSANRTWTALFLGVALGVSAIPVIAKILMDMRLQHRDVGQLILAAGIIDDGIGWVLLSVVSALAVSGGRTGAIGVSMALLAAVALGAATVGRIVIRAVLRQARRAPGVIPGICAVVGLVLPDKVRYVHSCRGNGAGRPTAVPARFVLACDNGHLDDFPWCISCTAASNRTPDTRSSSSSPAVRARLRASSSPASAAAAGRCRTHSAGLPCTGSPGSTRPNGTMSPVRTRAVRSCPTRSPRGCRARRCVARAFSSSSPSNGSPNGNAASRSAIVSASA